jgi:hypothetical protein
MFNHFDDIVSCVLNVLWMGNRFHPDLGKAISKCRRKLFLTVIATGVHSGNDAESWLGLDCLPSLSSLNSNNSAFKYLVQSL